MASPYFPTNISKNQARDTGMAMVLILLLVGYFQEADLWYRLAIPALLLNMIWPMLYYPIAVVWLGLSHLLGTIMSRILLSLIYIALVVPIGIYRRLRGKDTLMLRKFGKGDHSVMKARNHTFTAEELERPY